MITISVLVNIFGDVLANVIDKRKLSLKEFEKSQHNYSWHMK